VIDVVVLWSESVEIKPRVPSAATVELIVFCKVVVLTKPLVPRLMTVDVS
jgi:hypothetical protein